ncbi:MAG TPA: hypothetical protein VM143_09055 [Acidimicrobiales bacterium]|nr:hypothetical protein [Acidimicrobiales bacterium]
MREAADVELDLNVRRAIEATRARPESESTAQPVLYRPGMPADPRSLTMLQRSAGNAAVATLLRERTPHRTATRPRPLTLQRFAPNQPAPAPPTTAAGPTAENQSGGSGAGGGGLVEESIMVGTSGGGAAKQKGEGGDDAHVAGPPPAAAAKAERAAILADAAAAKRQLGAELAASQGKLGSQVGAAKATAVVALGQATAMSHAFFATKHAEVVAAASAAEQTATTQVSVMTAMAQAQAAVTYAQLNATAASISSGLQGRVSGFANQIVGAIGGLSLPDLPGVSQLKSAAAGLVRRAAGGVTAGIGFVQRLITGALRTGMAAVSSLIGKASSIVMSVIGRVAAAIRNAAARVTGVLMTISSRISQVLGAFLRGVVFPALDRLRAAASRHLVAGHKKATAAVKVNTNYHLSMLDKVARLAPPGGAKQGGPAGGGAGDDAVASFHSIRNSARENNKLVVDLFGGRLGAVVASVADMARRGASEIGHRISGAVTQIVSTVVGKVQEALQPVRAIATAIAGYVGSIVSSVRAALAGAVEWLRGAATAPIEHLVSFGSSAVGLAKNFLGSLLRNVLSGNFTLPGLGLGEFRPPTNAAGPVPTDAVTNSLGSSSSSVLGIIGTVLAVIAGIILLPVLLATALGLVLLALASLIVLGPLALLALVLYGAYRLVKWIFTPSKLTVTHETSLNAPSGAPKTRVEVAVGEKVRFDANKKGKWGASDGSPKSGATDSAFRWTAPDREATPTISIDVSGSGKEDIAFKVVEPKTVSAKREKVLDAPKGQQGAGMIVDFTYGPTNVSFGRVSAREVAGPASERDGYYATDGEKHFHQPKSSDFFQIGEDNHPANGVKDQASQFGSTPPWSKGRFVWYIPNRFLVAGEDGDGKQFAKVEQEFLMADETGKTTINKAGATVTRAPQ